MVIAPRTNDYHPDHRYTGVLVQDAAFMVLVPMVIPQIPSLKRNPVFLYYEDNFQKPQPFHPDLAVDINDVWQRKLDAFEANESQFYEAQPCWAGVSAEVPKDKVERRKWLEKRRDQRPTPAIRAALDKWYGPNRAKGIIRAEAFELCEYGRRPTDAEIRQLFPFFE